MTRLAPWPLAPPSLSALKDADVTRSGGTARPAGRFISTASAVANRSSTDFFSADNVARMALFRSNF
jgi:hypothetical protein